MALSGNRIAVLRANGEALVKEGGLSAGWIPVHTDVIQVALSGNRIAVLRNDGEALVKEGGLSAGWITEHTDVIQVALQIALKFWSFGSPWVSGRICGIPNGLRERLNGRGNG